MSQPTYANQPRFDAQSIIDAVKDLHEPTVRLLPQTDDSQDTRFAFVPRGMELKDLSPLLDARLLAPRRAKGTANVQDLDSFIALTNRAKDAHSALFGLRDTEKPALTAVLNYNTPTPEGGALLPRFGDHRVHYPMPVSEAWARWAAVDGEPMPQRDFAELIEDRIMDILDPPTDGRSDASALVLELRDKLKARVGGPMDLLEVSRGLKVHEASVVHNATTLSSGESEVQFKTAHTDEHGQPLKVPQMFILGLPVFEGGALWRLPARLRYRKVGPALMWIVQLYRPDLVFLAAFDEAAQRAAKETSLPLFLGSPEA